MSTFPIGANKSIEDIEAIHRAAAKSEACFAQSLELARRQGALPWELRAATSLARLRQRQGRNASGLDVLQPVFDSFTEGFETFDLLAASVLLASLKNVARSA